LGRITKITHANGTAISYSYNGHATQVTDENGVSRLYQVDNLGRLTTVCEFHPTAACRVPVRQSVAGPTLRASGS